MKKDRIHTMGWKGILLSVVLNLIFAFLAAVMFAGYFRDVEMQRIVDQGVTAEAEIIGSDHGGRDGLRLVYRYISDDGIKYLGGVYYKDCRTSEDAKKYIGTKIEIYIGISRLTGSPVCRPVSYGNDLKAYENLIYAGIFIFLIILYMVFLIIYLLFCHDKLPKRKKKGEVKQ